MSTNQNTNSTALSISTSMISKPGTKMARSQVMSTLKDKKSDKLVKLETLIQYLMKGKASPDFRKETKLFFSELMLEFGRDKEYFLPLVKFLDVAYIHKTNTFSSDKEQEAFKREVQDIVSNSLSNHKQSKKIDWRIAKKMLSLQAQFSFNYNLKEVDQVKKDILESFKEEVYIALEYLLWQNESELVTLAKKTLDFLLQLSDSPDGQDKEDLLEAILSGRFDKTKFGGFGLTNSLILGEDGGLYLLLNRLNQQQRDALVSQQIVTKDYLEDKVKLKDLIKGDKVVLGTGGFGTVRFAMSLLRSKSLPAEIVCVKKTKDFTRLGGSLTPPPSEQITVSTFDDYFTNDRAQTIYSPCIFDMALVTNKNMALTKDHRKGYLMMEMLPQNTAKQIFSQNQYQKWEYQKPYLIDVLKNTQELLNSNIAMTDLKPENTLYDPSLRKATIIDLGGSVKVATSQELDKFDIAKHSFQSTKGFQAPEIYGSNGIVNMHKALAYSCGKIIAEIADKSDYEDPQKISHLVEELTTTEPTKRISILEAIDRMKPMGDDSYIRNIKFSHYIDQVKDRLNRKKSAISINEDIDKTKDLLIALQATPLDPLKYTNQQTEDLFNMINDFFAPEKNTKEVMTIFGMAGSGKSIALQLKFIEAVNAWEPKKPLPIYFNLANGIDLDQIVKSLNNELGTDLNLDDLETPHLYIDSFDEGIGIDDKKESLIKSYLKRLRSPKILITCRTDYLEGNSYDWFTPESKELQVCYVAPINYKGHSDLSNMIEKYVCYLKQDNATKKTTQEYLIKIKELQLLDLINTGFMFFLVMEVLFQLRSKTERRINKVDIYSAYINHYQNTQINQVKNPAHLKKLTEISQNIDSQQQSQPPNLLSLITELGQYLAHKMHSKDRARLEESDPIFTKLGYEETHLLKHQSIFQLLRLLPLKIMSTHSRNRFISNQQIKIGFIHETIKNYYLVEAIISEIERKSESEILSEKSIVHDSELVKMLVLAMKDNPNLAKSFLKAIQDSKHDKSEPSITYASNSITLLVAAKYCFSGCNLSHISVKGANIVNGIFQNANFEKADLTGVNMSNVNLTGASLNEADMSGVNFGILPDLLGHTGWVKSVSFSPDGKFVASGSEDQTIKIWNSSNGECLQTLNGHTSDINSVSFSPDGKFVASGSKGETIKVWNSSTGECLQTLNGHTHYVNSVSFSPDGKFVASGSSDETIKIWNSSTGECLQTLNGHADSVDSVSFSPDGKFIASGSEDKTIKIWNSSTGECLQTLNEHTHYVYSVSFSPDGKFVASGSEDETIKIWNSSTGECLQTLNGHTSYVKSVSFSPDGKFVASGSEDQTIKIWNSSTGECLQALNGHSDGVTSVSFSPDGKFVASGSSDEIKIWNSSTDECLQTLNGHTHDVNSVSFSPDGKFVASGSRDKAIKIWNSSTGECLQTLNGHTSSVHSVIFSPDGKFVASGSLDKTIKIWNSRTGECLQTLYGHTGWVDSVSFSPDGKFVASGSEDQTIKIWNSSTGECLQTFNGYTLEVFSVSFSPNGKFVASGSKDETIKVWNSSTGECLQTLNGHTGSVNSVSFSPDGKFVTSGSHEAKLFPFKSQTQARGFLLKHSLAATPSVLTAVGASMEKAKISLSAKIILIQKGAIQPLLTFPLFIDNKRKQTVSQCCQLF